MVYLYNHLSCRNEKWKIMPPGNSTEKSHKHNGERKKTTTNNHTWHDFMSLKYRSEWNQPGHSPASGRGSHEGLGYPAGYITLFSLWTFIELCTFLHVLYSNNSIFFLMLALAFLFPARSTAIGTKKWLQPASSGFVGSVAQTLLFSIQWDLSWRWSNPSPFSVTDPGSGVNLFSPC